MKTPKKILVKRVGTEWRFCNFCDKSGISVQVVEIRGHQITSRICSDCLCKAVNCINGINGDEFVDECVEECVEEVFDLKKELEKL